jgi:hypothetical protein
MAAATWGPQRHGRRGRDKRMWLPASSFTVTSHASLPGESNATDEII